MSPMSLVDATPPIPSRAVSPVPPCLSKGIADRKFILLQGPSSPFFAGLGAALCALGAEVARIGVSPGDRLFWRRSSGRYLPFRGDWSGFGAFLDEVIAREGATDLVMLGDGRPLHRQAVDAARRAGPEGPVPWIVEHGYLRPDLILAEPWGMGGRSAIPRLFDGAEDVEAVAADPRFPASFARYAAFDVAFHGANLAGAWLRYPGYRPHAPDGPLREYAGWIGKLARAPATARARRAALERIDRHAGPLFLFPLQLPGDFQLQLDGTGEALEDILDRVIRSFARTAPQDAYLAVKIHPIDNGRRNWARMATDAAGTAAERVSCFAGGDLGALLARSDGVVTVNSTVGLTALRAGVPVLALGTAVYAGPGLAATGGLDGFWAAPQAPDAGRVARFSAFLRQNFHVPGGFDGPAAGHGAAALAAWLADPPGPARQAAREGR